MYSREDNINRIIEKKIEDMAEQHQKLRDSFSELISVIKQYDKKPITDMLLDDVQSKVNRFLKDNDLNINVSVELYKKDMIFLGHTIIDQIMWQSLL